MLYVAKGFQLVGFFVLCFGACCMDSDPVWIPAVLMIAGAFIGGIGTLIRAGYVED